MISALWSIFGYLGLAITTLPQLANRQRWRIVCLLINRQLYNAGLKAASINGVIAVILGVFVMSKAYSLIPTNASFGEFYARFFNIVVIREIGPLISGVILISRSASAVTAEIGYMQLYRQFDVLKATNMNPALIFLMPVLVAFPISLLLMFFYFNVICIVASYSVITIFHSGSVSFWVFLDALVNNITLVEVVTSVTKALIGGLLIGLTSVYYGSQVDERFTDVSRAISNANTMQLFSFFMLNVGLSYVTYL